MNKMVAWSDLPIQLRGPAENGKKENGSRFATFSGEKWSGSNTSGLSHCWMKESILHSISVKDRILLFCHNTTKAKTTQILEKPPDRELPQMVRRLPLRQLVSYNHLKSTTWHFDKLIFPKSTEQEVNEDFWQDNVQEFGLSTAAKPFFRKSPAYFKIKGTCSFYKEFLTINLPNCYLTRQPLEL